MKILKHIFFVSFFAITFFCFSQNNAEIKFENYSSEVFSYRRGLSQNSIQCIMQDSDGFMWIGTWDGLNRFDGYNFKIYRPDYINPEGKISNETVTSIAEDKNGNLWIGTDHGLNMFDKKNNEFTSFHYNFYNKNGLPADSIKHLLFDKSGLLWIATNNGLCSYDIEEKIFKTYYFISKNEATIPSNSVKRLFIDDNNFMWIGTNSGIAVMDLNTKSIKRIKNSNHNVKSIIQVDENIWVGTSSGLRFYNSNTLENVDLQSDFHFFDNSDITCLLLDMKNRVWIGSSDKGLNVYNIKTKKHSYINNKFNSRYGLSSNSIQSLYMSKFGEIWVGTFNGLNMFSDYSFKFPHYRIIGPHYDYKKNVVSAFHVLKNGNLLVGTSGGIVSFNTVDKSIHDFSPENFDDVQVRAINILENGDVWVGTVNKGLYLLDENGRMKKCFKTQNTPGLISNTIWDIKFDKKGFLWLAMEGGVSKMDLKTHKFNNWQFLGREEKDHISGSFIRNLCIDKNGIVWLATFNGLNRLDPATGKIFVFHHDKRNPNSLPNDRILSVFESSDGYLWIASFGGGLSRYDRKTATFTNFNVKNGLPDNVIYDIIEDDKGFLWLTSNVGLIKFNPLTSTFIKYDVNDGIQSSEFNLGAAYILPNGEIAVGGMNGFNLFNPNKIVTNKYVPKIVIPEFKIFGEALNRSIQDGDTVILKPGNNFFSISFSALDFANPSKNNYAYILSNYDKDWIKVDASKRIAEYTDVTPGTYKFTVKGANSDGLWNNEGISFTIIVKPRFYKTWFFKFSLIFLSMVTVFILIRVRIKKIRKKSEVDKKMLKVEKEKFDLEQRALRLQMNPHFIFNSLNSIQSYIISNETESAVNYLAKFSQLMRLILSTSREKYISLSQEILLLKYYIDMENMRFKNKFNYEIRVEGVIDTDKIGIPPMIIQPHVENAIIHGLLNKKNGNCNLFVQFWKQETHILCVIEDNGIGRDKAKEIKQNNGLLQKPQGIAITKERLDILNKDIKNKTTVEIIDLKDENDNPSGTRVRLIIPFIDL
ncbi:MAG: histidine kinase [Bacteroidales bacterium]|nr:histidine kinase [Bacteroidales bacterium]